MKQKQSKISFVIILLFFFIIIFTFITIYLLPDYHLNGSLLSQYYDSYASYFSAYKTFLIGGLLILLVILFKRFRFEKSITFLYTVFFAFHLSLVFVFIIAALQVYTFNLLQNTGKSEIKIQTDLKEINESLAADNQLPEISFPHFPYKKQLVLLAVQNGNGFYDRIILPSLPDAIYEELHIPTANIVLIHNHLLIQKLQKEELAAVSPGLGKVLTQKLFPNQSIRYNPKIEILDRKTYTKFRDEQINQQIAVLDGNSEKIENAIQNLQQQRDEIAKTIEKYQKLRQDTHEEKKKVNTQCLAAGYKDKTGTLHRIYTDAQCEQLQSQYDSAVKNLDNRITNGKNALQFNKLQLNTYQINKEHIAKARTFVLSKKAVTPLELGIFIPENTIKIVLDSQKNQALPLYFYTLIHEYLHFTSYISEQKHLDPFFEEALTEYFARKAVLIDTGETIDYGYPLAVRIINAAVSKIPEKQLAELYFSKDQQKLEKLLDKTYGKDFYQQNAYYFSTLNYLPFDDALQETNIILKQMDAKPLTKDIIVQDSKKSLRE